LGVAKPYIAGVLEGGDWFNELLLDHGGPGPLNLISIAWRLRRRAIDVAVLFPNSFRSALAARLGSCKRRIGDARYARSWLLTDALAPVRDEQGRITPSPTLDAYNRLAEAAGTPSPSKKMELFTTVADEVAAERVWDAARFFSYREVICLNPGAAFG